MYMIDFTVLLAPGVVEDKLKPPHIQYPAWVVQSDGRRTRIRMVTDDAQMPVRMFRDITYPIVTAKVENGFFCTAEFPLPDWFDASGYVKKTTRGTSQYTKATLPGGAPVYQGDKIGKIKATITMAKPESKIYQKAQVIEEITGSDATRMGLHIEDFLYWLQNYDAYYSCKGWTYEVKWKGLPTPA